MLKTSVVVFYVSFIFFHRTHYLLHPIFLSCHVHIGFTSPVFFLHIVCAHSWSRSDDLTLHSKAHRFAQRLLAHMDRHAADYLAHVSSSDDDGGGGGGAGSKLLSFFFQSAAQQQAEAKVWWMNMKRTAWLPVKVQPMEPAMPYVILLALFRRLVFENRSVNCFGFVFLLRIFSFLSFLHSFI